MAHITRFFADLGSIGDDARFTRRMLALSALIFLFLITAGAAAIYMANRSAAAEDAIIHGTEVRRTARSLLVELLNAETGQRGFLLTADEKYLEPYAIAKASLDTLLANLRELTSDNESEQRRIQHLKSLIDAKMGELLETVILMRQGQHADALGILNSGRGKQLMDGIRAEIEEIFAEERELLTARRSHANALRNVVLELIGLCLASSMALAVLILLAITHYAQRLNAEAQLRRETEDMLRQSQKIEAVGQLTGGIAHDFNNMLAVIISGVTLAQKRLAKGEAGAESFLSSVAEGAQRAAALVKRLLAFSRQQPLDPKPIDANKFVAGLSELISRSLGKSINVETILGGGLWLTHADPAQLENSILNLCVNARDAMPEGGRLTVETANCHLDDRYSQLHPGVPAGQYVLVAVTDTGTGMTPEVIAKAFDPFFTTKDVGKGTGLGLSQVFGFVKQSGGHVKIYSEPGHGTTVKVYLPRYYSAEPHQAAELSAKHIEFGGTEAILLVEDDASVLAMTAASLRELGYRVSEAAHAKEAVAQLKNGQTYDLLLTDIVMPDINGRKLADEAATLCPNLKVLFMTGFTKNAIVHNGVLDPGVNFLAKPFTSEELARKVREAIGMTTKT